MDHPLLSTETRDLLVEHVRRALQLADEIGETVAALHLDAALVALTGQGESPVPWTD